MRRWVVMTTTGALFVVLLVASSACSSATRASSTAASMAVSSAALAQARALCAKFVPPLAGSGNATVKATTAGAITAEQERLHGQPLSPWNLLPQSQLVAECTYEGPNVPTTEGTLLCPDGSEVGVPVPRRYLIDDQGHSTTEDAGPTDQRALQSASLLCPH